MALGAVLGGALGLPWRAESPAVAPDDAAVALRGFRALAWAEGGSLLLMVAVAMPLRAATGFDLDGDSQLLGWVHGALVLAYLQALASTGRLRGWPKRRWAAGLLAALVPGGVIWFDRALAREAASG